MADIFTEISTDINTAIHDNLITPALVERGYGWISQLRTEYPLVYKITMAIVYGDPVNVLAALSLWNPEFRDLRKNPMAIKYVKLLQERLRNGDREV